MSEEADYNIIHAANGYHPLAARIYFLKALIEANTTRRVVSTTIQTS